MHQYVTGPVAGCHAGRMRTVDFRPICGHCGHRDARLHEEHLGPDGEEPCWCRVCEQCRRTGMPAVWQLL